MDGDPITGTEIRAPSLPVALSIPLLAGAAVAVIDGVEMLVVGPDAVWGDDDAPAGRASRCRPRAVRVPEMFGPVVPIADDAPQIDQLAAYLGRRPWDVRATSTGR